MRVFLVLVLVALWVLVPTSAVLADSTSYIDVTVTGAETEPAVSTLTPVVGSYDATLRGLIINDYGHEITERGFEWGESTGVYTDNWSEVGSYSEGIFTHSENYELLHTYYYRAFAISDLGIGYGEEKSFTTSVQAPTNLDAYKINNNLVGVTWDKGLGTDNTYIVRKIGSYPEDRDDGVLVYWGPSDNTTDNGVDFGYITSGAYYYRAWGEQGGNFTDGYTQDFVGGEGMLILSLIFFCGLLTGLSGWKRFLPLAMAASIAWLAFGILALTSPETIGVGSISESWVQAMGFALVLMIFVPILLYVKPTTTISKSREGLSWTEQSGIPKDKTSRRERVQREYRQQLRDKWHR